MISFSATYSGNGVIARSSNLPYLTKKRAASVQHGATPSVDNLTKKTHNKSNGLVSFWSLCVFCWLLVIAATFGWCRQSLVAAPNLLYYDAIQGSRKRAVLR